MFTKNNNIKVKRKIDGKINIYICYNDCSFKIFATTDAEEVQKKYRK